METILFCHVLFSVNVDGDVGWLLFFIVCVCVWLSTSRCWLPVITRTSKHSYSGTTIKGHQDNIFIQDSKIPIILHSFVCAFQHVRFCALSLTTVRLGPIVFDNQTGWLVLSSTILTVRAFFATLFFPFVRQWSCVTRSNIDDFAGNDHFSFAIPLDRRGRSFSN